MELNLHHIGILVAEIPLAASEYARRFGYVARTAIIHDPMQTAYVQFLALPGTPVYLELVAPDRPDSKLTNALRKGGGLNHLCYVVLDLEAACLHLRAEGMILIQAPIAAVAFEGRRLAWLGARDRIPIELVEAGGPGSL